MQIFGLGTTRPPRRTFVATNLAEVRPLLARAEHAAAAGNWVALFVTYDAAAAFDPAMQVRAGSQPRLPLAWAAEFDRLEPVTAGRHPAPDTSPTSGWTPSIPQEEFCRRVQVVQRHIAEGDTYQVNLTFPLHAEAANNVETWFARLLAIQPAAYAACIEVGDTAILSLSPELFFESDGRRLRARPMKGTIGRGRWLAEDQAMARALATSPKARAENVMIVDLLRNDIGRVAVTGSVHVPSRFTVERYPTLWQLTSTVEGDLRAGTTLADVFDALFPCGSVTGAPKIRTMEIISQLEDAPRGLYTGTIGLLQPGGEATFSVAIRTVVVDRAEGIATLGVGAGITADSVPEDEYAECLLKAAFASPAAQAHAAPFDLLETMRLENGRVIRIDRHLHRARNSAEYFGFSWDEPRVRAAVEGAVRQHASGVWRLRLTISAEGTPAVACSPHDDAAARMWHVAFANAPVDERDPFLFNKTTNRHPYEAARRGRPDVDDVLLWNRRGELTESTIANVVVEIAGERWTPPLDCGLLGGTLREELLETGRIRERVITRGEAMRATRLWLINGLRGWIDATVVR